jgi:hypothetical protein
LPDYLKALLASAQAADARFGGVLGEARDYGQHLHTLRFCLDELIPLLRASGETSGHCDEGWLPLSAPRFQSLERRAEELLRQLDQPLPPLATPRALAGLVGAPCVISDGRVIPLSPVAAAEPPDFFVTVGSEGYVLRSEEARSFSELLQDLRREQERRVEQSIRSRPELTRMASDFLGEVKPILHRRDSRDCGSYQLFHRDSDHQLQHFRGHWLLIRGPVASRIRGGNVFVGLRLAGRERRDWLAVAPRPGVKEEGFWTPDGGPLAGGICVGDWRQYQRLLSDRFSDAEAVVEWLDAGVILVTGRSEFHRRLRAGQEKPLQGRRVTIPPGPSRPC